MRYIRSLTAVAAMLCASTASAQITGGTKIGTKAPITSTTTTCSGDKFLLAGFSISPTAPTVSQTVTVTAQIKNNCAQTLNIPYKLSDGSAILASGTKSVGAGQTATVQQTMTATVGAHALDAYLDAGNTLGESTANIANNGAASLINFTIAPPPMASRYLKYSEAQQAGAQFEIRITNEALCTAVREIAQSNKPDNPTGLGWAAMAPCAPPYFDLFKNFTLKNGWKVKAVNVTSTALDNATWQWDLMPVVGSASPHGILRVSAAIPQVPMAFQLYVFITIEGPQGTSPY